MARLYKDNPQDIKELADAIQSGQLVVVPTETVYGLAADALNENAVRQVFNIKGRPLIDPLIVHVLDIQSATSVAQVTQQAQLLADTFWPGPLTLVLKKQNGVPDIVTANLATVAIRSPKHPVFRNLLKVSKKPLATPSANPFGYVSPTTSEHVQTTLGEKVSYILEGGACNIGIESTVLSIVDPQNPTILRLGPVSQSALEAVLKQAVTIQTKSKIISAPGMLEKHYSPNTPIVLIENGQSIPDDIDSDTAIIYFKKPAAVKNDRVFWLTESGSTEEAARNLYFLLQQLDKKHYTHLIAEMAPNEGLGGAINDRLRRASA